MEIIVVLLLVLIIYYCSDDIIELCKKYISAEGFGPCNNCPTPPEYTIYSLNPYRWPSSGSMYKSQWQYSPMGKKPPNTTDEAEALPPNNPSGMNVLSVPDEEYKTN